MFSWNWHFTLNCLETDFGTFTYQIQMSIGIDSRHKLEPLVSTGFVLFSIWANANQDGQGAVELYTHHVASDDRTCSFSVHKVGKELHPLTVI